MNDEYEYIHHEINRLILLLRTENDVEKKQSFLDEISKMNAENRKNNAGDCLDAVAP